ncbi:uncharacterized protein LOC135152246 [Daucus carota subsp. sativus]|uniref:uncharacterized protein LOC135152246 n=1 Tax=Daucus carota subsp. sativus TaxID=79200 RepID=UPI0030838EF2
MAQYEQFGSNPGEGISEVFIKYNNLINNLNLNGKYYDNKEKNLKFLLTLPEHLEHRITAIRESRDLHEISLEKPYGVLKTYELEQVQTKQRYGWGKTLWNSRALIVETPQLEEKKDVNVLKPFNEKASGYFWKSKLQEQIISSRRKKPGYTDSDEEEQLGNVAFMVRSGSSSPPHAGSSLVEEERIRCKAFKDASTLVKEINDQQEINRTVGIGYDYNKSVGKKDLKLKESDEKRDEILTSLKPIKMKDNVRNLHAKNENTSPRQHTNCKHARTKTASPPRVRKETYVSKPKTKVYKAVVKEVSSVKSESNGSRGIVRVVWVLDSGASRHMTGINSLLTEVRKATGPSVTFADNSKGRTIGYGNYKVGKIIIEEIAIVEGLKHNLLSISQFCDKGYSVHFEKETCKIKHIKNERPSLFGIRKGNIYIDDLSSGPGNAI